MMHEPAAELRTLVEKVLGAPATYRFCGWPHLVNHVWEVQAGGARYHLKRHGQPYKFTRERRFYEEWAPQLDGMTPRLVAALPDALLITALPGDRMEEIDLEPEEERAIFQQAGRFKRLLNDIPYEDPQTVTLAEELTERMEGWLDHAKDYVAARDLAWVRERYDPRAPFRDAVRVPTPRDFQPRNWIVDRTTSPATLGVFDFEHASGDTWLLGLVKLWDAPWIGRPDLAESFWEGYGRALTADELEQFEHILLLHAIGVIVWSRKNNDAHYEAHGRNMLARLQAARS